MTTDRVNYLNMSLMVGAAIAAFVLPFEVFLLSYAVLGPLHYLTEISWLHDRSYFLKDKRDYTLFVVLWVLVLLVSHAKWPADQKSEVRALIYYTAFAGAAVLLMARTTAAKVLAFALIVISFFVTKQAAIFQVIFGVFLPTIIHVFLFTGAFILLGALRTRSKSGVAAFGVLVLCAVGFFIFTPLWPSYHVSDYVRQTYAPFEIVNVMLVNLFNLAPGGTRDVVYSSAAGLAVMRFIAFAYLYHYLNWFSKTSIIKWNRISRTRGMWILALWLVSLCIYVGNNRVGIVLMTLFSILHGFLEMPLDHQTFYNIGKEVLAFATATRTAGPDARFAAAKTTMRI